MKITIVHENLDFQWKLTIFHENQDLSLKIRIFHVFPLNPCTGGRRTTKPLRYLSVYLWLFIQCLDKPRWFFSSAHMFIKKSPAPYKIPALLDSTSAFANVLHTVLLLGASSNPEGPQYLILQTLTFGSLGAYFRLPKLWWHLI